MKSRFFAVCIGLTVSVSMLAAGAANQPLDAPEAAYWHAESQTWLVSSLGGGLSLARDGIGWLARYDAQGRLLDPRWIDGLDAPTGIASVGNRVYVADRAGVHEIDVPQAKRLRTIQIPGSIFLNDVAAAPNGDLFVSDFEANRIYRLDQDRKPEIWLEGEQLQNPNGLIVDGDHLVIATWGPMTDPKTFAVKHPGTVLRAHLKSKALTPLGDGKPIASFDGIVKVGDDYFATDWPGGRLLRIAKTGEAREVLAGNRNFEARIHPNLKANFLASPPLVVATTSTAASRRSYCASCSPRDRDPSTRSLSRGRRGSQVHGTPIGE